jgi:conjugal transfer ATP-binding protein TraC
MEIDLSKIAKGNHDYDTRTRDIVDRGSLRINDLIAPDAIELEVNHIKIGNRYTRTVIVTGYPRTSYIGWLNRLYSYPANIDISSHIEPLATDKVIKALTRKIGQYVSTQRLDAEKGRLTDISVDTALLDASTLRDYLHKGQEKLFYQTIYINIAGKTVEELDAVTEEIETLCGSLAMTTRHAMYQQDQGFLACLPIADDRLRFKRNFDTSSLATCLPIVSAELTNTKGMPILYGLNMINGSLVLFDRFSLNNYNSVTLATSGAGKSYFVKLEAIRYMGLGAHVIIIDPQGEYKRLAETLGGQYVNISSISKDRINPLEISIMEDEEDGMNFLNQKVLDVTSIIEIMIVRTLPAREKKVLMDAIEKTYAQFGITREKSSLTTDDFIEGDYFKLEGSKKKMPILSDLEAILRQKGQEGIDIADELQPYTTGFMNLFNGETNVNTDSPFIVFDIKDMEKQISDLAMFITLEFIWNKIKKGDMKKRLLIVDEAWMLLKNETSAEYVVRIAKTARKFNAGLSIISQQAADFIKNGGQGIIGNTSMQILLKQSKNDIYDVAEMFDLSQREQSFLKTAKPGEALIFAGDNHTEVSVVAHEFEHLLCTTNPQDMEKIKEMMEKG